MTDHARVFEPVPHEAQPKWCSRDCIKYLRMVEVAGWRRLLTHWWRGHGPIKAACRHFDCDLSTIRDGDVVHAQRCYACLQSETTLPTVEQWLAEQTEPTEPRAQLHVVVEDVDELLATAAKEVKGRKR